MKSYAWILGLAPALAMSQITPDHAYNGVNRPFPIRVRANGDAQIQILEPVTADVRASAPVESGTQDLAKIFPSLWKWTTLHYAQLVVGGKKVGPALVLQPMLNPILSRLAADGKTVEFVPDEDGPMFNGFRAWVDQDLFFETSLGNMRFRLRPDCAPNTAWTIMQLAKEGLYTNTIFHRVVAKRPDGSPFVIQGGDPTGTGSGGAGFAYPLEDSKLEHDYGVISIARSTDPNTNGCQIFVALSREGTKHLDHRYAAFGQAIEGADTIAKIAGVKVGKDDRPDDPPVIKRVRLVNAAPYGTGPSPLKKP